MGRAQKLRSSAAKMRGVDPSNSASKRLKVASPIAKVARARRPSDEISRDSVAAHALATFGSPEKAQHWMNRPNPLFHGKTPAQMIKSDLVAVEAELVRIDHGVYM
jgi:uncharacterized protein (DUF2384 family)